MFMIENFLFYHPFKLHNVDDDGAPVCEIMFVCWNIQREFFLSWKFSTVADVFDCPRKIWEIVLDKICVESAFKLLSKGTKVFNVLWRC